MQTKASGSLWLLYFYLALAENIQNSSEVVPNSFVSRNSNQLKLRKKYGTGSKSGRFRKLKVGCWVCIGKTRL